MRRAAALAIPAVAGALAAGGAYAVLDRDGGAAAPGARARTPPAAASVAPDGATATRAGSRPDGRAVFARMGCGSCHTLAAAGSRGPVAPNLDERLPSHTAASLRAKILDPSGGAGESFSGMPEDFGERMTRAELDALIRFLLRARGAPTASR